MVSSQLPPFSAPGETRQQHSEDYITKEDTFIMYTIESDCISCGSCADACPAGAISEGEQHYEIDADKCLSCGTCVDACPTSAIVEK